MKTAINYTVTNNKNGTFLIETTNGPKYIGRLYTANSETEAVARFEKIIEATYTN